MFQKSMGEKKKWLKHEQTRKAFKDLQESKKDV